MFHQFDSRSAYTHKMSSSNDQNNMGRFVGHHSNYSAPHLSTSGEINDDLYNVLLHQTPEEAVAGLQAKNEVISRNGFAGSIPDSELGDHHEGVTIEALLEEDPLLSFTTTLDRQESNDTILQLSSPIASPMEPEKIVEALTLNEAEMHPLDHLTNENNTSLSPLASVPQIQHPNYNQQQYYQAQQQYQMKQTHQNQLLFHHQQQQQQQQAQTFNQPPATYLASQIQLQSPVATPEVALSQNHLQQQTQQSQQHQLQNKPQNEQQFLHFRAQIQNQVMFQQNNPSISLQQSTIIPPQPHATSQQQVPRMALPQPLDVTSNTPEIGFNNMSQFPPPQSPHLIQQQVLYAPVRNSSQSPSSVTGAFPSQKPMPKQRIRSQSRSATTSKPPTPPSSKPPSSKRTTKPPLNKSNSTTSLNKVKKNSISSHGVIGGTTSKIVLQKSKSFLSTPTSVSSKPFYQTLDFSKNFSNFLNQSPPSLASSNGHPSISSSANPSSKDRLKKAQQKPILKTTPYKNYEFVFEQQSQSKSSSRPPSSSKSSTGPRRGSVPTSATTPSASSGKLLNFSKPPSIDTSFYSPNSSSPSNSDASGTSPLGSLNLKPLPQSIHHSPVPISFQKITPESYSSSSSSNENFVSVEPKARRNGGDVMKIDVGSDSDESPSFQLKSMKSGMNEFKVRNNPEK